MGARRGPHLSAAGSRRLNSPDRNARTPAPGIRTRETA